MIKNLVSLLDESALACSLLIGLSIAAAVVFGVAAVAAAVCTFAVSPYWAIAFILFGLFAGLAGGLGQYIYAEYY